MVNPGADTVWGMGPSYLSSRYQEKHLIQVVLYYVEEKFLHSSRSELLLRLTRERMGQR